MKHTLKGYVETREVYLDGILLNPEISKKYHKHAETFDWGNPGAGSAQLALAVNLRLKKTFEGYQRLKFEIIAGLPKDRNFEITFDSQEERETAEGYALGWTRKAAILNARAYNKYISEELFSLKTNQELMCWVHPSVRDHFIASLGVVKNDIINF